MSEKVLLIIERMIRHPEKISDIVYYESEYYFKFEKKYIWSVAARSSEEGYILYFYPLAEGTIGNLIGALENAPDELEVVQYKFDSFDNKENAKIKLKQVYFRLRELHLGLDSKFDDMLK